MSFSARTAAWSTELPIFSHVPMAHAAQRVGSTLRPRVGTVVSTDSAPGQAVDRGRAVPWQLVGLGKNCRPRLELLKTVFC